MKLTRIASMNYAEKATPAFHGKGGIVSGSGWAGVKNALCPEERESCAWTAAIDAGLTTKRLGKAPWTRLAIRQVIRRQLGE